MFVWIDATLDEVPSLLLCCVATELEEVRKRGRHPCFAVADLPCGHTTLGPSNAIDVIHQACGTSSLESLAARTRPKGHVRQRVHADFQTEPGDSTFPPAARVGKSGLLEQFLAARPVVLTERRQQLIERVDELTLDHRRRHVADHRARQVQKAAECPNGGQRLVSQPADHRAFFLLVEVDR